jgi:hypothetical protein
MRACTHAGPCAFGRTPRARCELRLPQRRDALHADVLAAHGSCDVSKPSTSVGVSICRSLERGTSPGPTVCSRQRCALRGVDAHAVQSMLPVGLPADVLSCASTPRHRFATFCADPFGSPWLRKSSRFPLRPRRRRVHSGRAMGRRLPGEPIVWSSSGQLIGACSSPRSGPTLQQGKADAAGLRIFTHRSGAADVADRPTKPPLMGRGVQ